MPTLENKHQSLRKEFENVLKDCQDKRKTLMKWKDKPTRLVANFIEAENNAAEMETKLNNLARLIEKGKNMDGQKVEKVVAPSPNLNPSPSPSPSTEIKIFNEPKVEDTNSSAPV